METQIEPTAGGIVRQEFAGTETQIQAEMASVAVAAQAKALVEARYIMALRRPRDIMLVRQRLLNACKRPRFADEAMYEKPVGGQKITGLSIRFAEEAVKAMGNVMPDVSIIYDDHERRIVRISTTDLESNVTYTNDLTLAKTVERSKVREGQTVIRKRMNSSGKETFIVEATEDELQVKQSAQVSKIMREQILRILPSDIKEEAREQIEITLRNEGAQDPEALRKRTVDAFAAIGITAAHLAEYLGKQVAEATPDELTALRRVGAAIKEQQATWAEALAAKKGETKEDVPAEKKSRTEDLKEKLTKGKAEKAAEEAKDKPAAKLSNNAEAIIAQAKAAKSAADIERAQKNFKTYASTLEPHEIETIEAELADAERRLGM